MNYEENSKSIQPDKTNILFYIFDLLVILVYGKQKGGLFFMRNHKVDIKLLFTILITSLLPVLFDIMIPPSIPTAIFYLFFWFYIGYRTRMGFKKGLISGSIGSLIGILALITTGLLLLFHQTNSFISFVVTSWLTPTSNLYQNFTPLLVASPLITTALTLLGSLLGHKIPNPTNRVTWERIVNIYIELILLYLILPDFPIKILVTSFYACFWFATGYKSKTGWKKGLLLGAWGALPGILTLGLFLPIPYPKPILYTLFYNSVVWCPPLITFQFNKTLIILSPIITMLLTCLGSLWGSRHRPQKTKEMF